MEETQGSRTRTGKSGGHTITRKSQVLNQSRKEKKVKTVQEKGQISYGTGTNDTKTPARSKQLAGGGGISVTALNGGGAGGNSQARGRM